MKEHIVRISAPSPDGKSPLKSRPSNESYFYPVTRAVSFWPQVNGNGAFFEEDKLAPLVNSSDEEDTFIGKLVNIWHDKGTQTGNRIIGAIKDQAVVPGSGVDLMARIDRKAADVYGITPDDFKADGEYCSSSIEIFCDFDRSTWVALTNPGSKDLNDQTIFTPEQADDMGMSRTALTGYKYQDKYEVVEGMWPLRCRGLAFLDDPADPTANVFELAASRTRNTMSMTLDELLANKQALTPGQYHADPGFLSDKKERYQLDTPEHVKSAASLFGMNKDKYSPEEQRHILSAISEARTRLGMKPTDDERASFSNDAGDTYDVGYGLGDDSIPGCYFDVTCSDMSDEECQSLPDEAFASVYTTADGHSKVRKGPLYRTVDDVKNNRPEPGLVKSAMASLSKPAYSGGYDLNPNLHAAARNKVREAHKQLFPQGATKVDPKEKEVIEQAAFQKGAESRNDEVAGLNSQVSELTTKVTTLTDSLTSVTTERDEAAAKLASVSDEKAGLEQKIAVKEAEELAAKRLTELSEIDGFVAGTDDEKAALLADLAKEDEVSFRLRKQDEVNASLQRQLEAARKAAASNKDEKAGKDEEQAARERVLALQLDDVPVHGAMGKDGSVIDASACLM